MCTCDKLCSMRKFWSPLSVYCVFWQILCVDPFEYSTNLDVESLECVLCSPLASFGETSNSACSPACFMCRRYPCCVQETFLGYFYWNSTALQKTPINWNRPSDIAIHWSILTSLSSHNFCTSCNYWYITMNFYSILKCSLTANLQQPSSFQCTVATYATGTCTVATYA